MNISSVRNIDTRLVSRRQATADTKRKVSGWAVWECADPDFHYYYERTVSFYVQSGKAELIFDDGFFIEIDSDDFVTIEQGARVQWTIIEPIKNYYCYHDSFESAGRPN